MDALSIRASRRALPIRCNLCGLVSRIWFGGLTMVERKDWNLLISHIVTLHKKTKDDRFIALHNVVVTMALEDHEKFLQQKGI